MSEKEDLRYIVRVAGKDLEGGIRIDRSLQGLKGLGQRSSKLFADAFLRENNLKKDTKLGDLNDEQVRKLEEVISNPEKHGIPAFNLNRQRDFEEDKDKHLIMSDLDLQIRTDIQRMKEIKSYKGLRHTWGLPVRGQKTRSTHRGKGGVVGVTKKDVKAAAAGAAKEEKKEKK
jgi:small subunit ribosomal protein S13